MNKSLRKTLYEMCFGLFIYEVLLLAALYIWADKLSYTRASLIAGVLLGTVCALIMLLDMARTAEDVISSCDAAYAQKKTVLRSALRQLGLVLVVAVCWYFNLANILALVLAVLGIKPGAYLQPLAHKLFSKS